MLCLLDNALECKDVVDGLVLKSKSNISSSFESPSLMPPRNLLMEDRSIEFGKRVATMIIL